MLTVSCGSCCCVVVLQAGLSKRVHLFLSDVETDTWSQQDVRRVVSSSAQVIITQGEKGATLLVSDSNSSNGIGNERSSKTSGKSSSKSSSSSSFQQWKIPAVKVRGLVIHSRLAAADSGGLLQCWLRN